MVSTGTQTCWKGLPVRKVLLAGVIYLVLFVSLLLIANSLNNETAPQPPDKWETIFKGRGA